MQNSAKMNNVTMIKRTVEKTINLYLKEDTHKILFIWGPRRSGKTTLLKILSSRLHVPIFNFDTISDREKFIPRREVLQKIVSAHKTILIDEVQNHPEATIALKILFDEFKVKIIATGSSELRQKGKEFDTLTGRFREAYCLPLSLNEMQENSGLLPYEKDDFEKAIQQDFQIFGSYPELYAAKSSDTGKIELLENILESYVIKDIALIYDLKNAKLAKDVLTKIALQLGCEVSIREIANSLQANESTVSNYIEIFIKNYILIALPSFKTNMRKAVSENRKLYFYDLGIRNALVKDFRELGLRPDRGGVFENFIISEMEKRRKNTNVKKMMYFYREYGGKEVNLVIEDYYKKYVCMEIKTGEGKVKDIFPLPHTQELINSKNYFDTINKIMG